MAMKPYLTDRRLSKEDVQLLFKLRTKMVDVKTNFKSQYSDLICRICKSDDSVENENHLIDCEMLNEEISDITFNYVYEDIEKQMKAVKLFKKILRRRQKLIDLQ